VKRINTQNKSKEELTANLFELQAKLAQLRFEQADKKLKDSSQFKKTKKDIARVLTRLRAESIEVLRRAGS